MLGEKCRYIFHCFGGHLDFTIRENPRMGQITRPAFRVLGVFFPTLGSVSADFRLQLFQPFTLTANFVISVAVVNFGEFLAQQSRQQIGLNLSIQQKFALQLGLTFT